MILKKMSAAVLVAMGVLVGASALEAKVEVWTSYLNISKEVTDDTIKEAQDKIAEKGLQPENSSLSIRGIEDLVKLQSLLDTFTNYSSIEISGSDITDLNFIKKMPNIEKIYISKNYKQSSPLDISALTDNKKVVDISFYSVKINDLAPLSGCENIKALKISSCEILSNTISPLKTLTNLETLDFYGSNIDSFAHLAPLTKLKKIGIYATKANKDSSLNYDTLSEIKSLEEISAGLTSMTSVAFMKDLPNVKSITFLGEKLDDIENFENAKSLEYISFWSHRFEIDCNKLSKAKSLKKLRFWSTSGVINWSGLASLTGLEDLNIDGVKNCNSSANPVDTAFLGSLAELKKLQLREVEVHSLPKLPSTLTEVSLDNINKASTTVFDVDKLVAPNVTKVSISGTKVSNVDKIIKNCPRVQYLTLQKLEGVENYEFLKELLPKTRVTLSKGAISEEFKNELKDKDIYVNMW